MLIARFIPPSSDRSPGREPLWGIVEGETVLELRSSPYDGIGRGRSKYPLPEVRLLPPVEPSKVVAVGWNYEEHIRELGSPFPTEPLLFLKAPSSVIGPGDPIVLPPESERVDYEGELAIVIGKRCRRVGKEEAKDKILGYTALNDVTARDLQRKDGQFSRAKSFDTFCPVGPWVRTDMDPSCARVTTSVNGELRQDDNTSTVLFDPFFIVQYVSAVMTLVPGDVIATGTPSGVGPLHPGDEVTVSVEGVGGLTNTVVREVP